MFLLLFFIPGNLHSQFVYDWHQQESKHFIVIYRDSHAHLVPHILRSAENALQTLMRIFHYSPSEKIVINTYDFSDYGSAGTTTVPHNFIRLEIEPFELGYETMPFNERLQWILSHELVHVAMNDQGFKIENLNRKLFSKVPPEKSQPITVLYSLITNFSRYTPRWHQEGIAVFIETWFSGGFGRMLSNFDEMYFRTLVVERRAFSSMLKLDGKDTHTSYLLEMLFYLYGVRFVSYLAITYGEEKVLSWFTIQDKMFYQEFETKFKKTFGCEIQVAWSRFIEQEKKFQEANLRHLRTAPLTPARKLYPQAFGWVTQPYIDSHKGAVIFGNHQAHYLTALNEIDLTTGKRRIVGSLPSPSMLQVASTAYDPTLQIFFFTTNNNQLYRDIWVEDLNTQKKKQIFHNARIGQLTVSPRSHELWGVQHSGGKAAIIYSPYPYHVLIPTVQFEIGDELQQLAIRPDGKKLAAVLHRASGEQAIIVAECEPLKKHQKFQYIEISKEGTPEYPSWSPDGGTLFWNAYTNGVSNVYRYRFETNTIEALSHTLTGLFRPVFVSRDTLLAFKFTSEGFLPVLIPNRPAEHLPAIQYLGQKVVEKNPSLKSWVLQPADRLPLHTGNPDGKKKYSGFSRIEFHSFIPIISGFLKQKVLGFYTHLADPLYIHDLTFEFGYSPFNETPLAPNIHFKGKYEFKRRFKLGMNHNATDFYDLLNHRKRGLIGTKIIFGYTHFWLYDNPHKIKQSSELAIYTGIEAINDNLVRVSRPDFFVLQTAINSSNTRRSIGSTDKESGANWAATAMFFGVDPHDFHLVGGVHVEWDGFTTWLLPHNIWHLKIAAGTRHTEDHLAIGKFYFGGFGNRYLENVDVKQFRKVFRFPGIPIYRLPVRHFVKIMVENNLPPLRLAWPLPGPHYLNHLDASWYSQAMLVDSFREKRWIDLGAQINLVIKHWYNLESTVSAGVARAWNENGTNWEWFISYKILR